MIMQKWNQPIVRIEYYLNKKLTRREQLKTFFFIILFIVGLAFHNLQNQVKSNLEHFRTKILWILVIEYFYH